MSVEQLDVIDVISTDRLGHVVLTVSDHLDWFDTVQHQNILQAKLNKYLAFVESGDILESYPDAKGRPVVFKVMFKFRPDPQGFQFLANAKSVIELAGFSLQEAFAEPSDN